MAPRTGSQWDHKSDKDLLLSIIDTGSLKGIDWKSISDKMKQKGHTFTHEACRQHFQKLRKEARPGDGDDGGNSPIKSNSAKSTPRKRSKTQSASFSSNSFHNEDDDEELMTPVKRKKTEVKPEQENGGFPGQTAPLFKIEALDGNDSVLLDDDDLYAV